MKQGWKKLPFEEVIADVSGGNVKTPQGEFLPEGRFAIVDQGKELISGYANEEKRLCHADLPVIIFGDHTRCFKYVDFPFCMGADGVKVLRPKIDADVKYLYYYLRQLHITDGGYSRHFKYLKQCEVVLPPLEEQRKIVDILDRTEALRAKRRAALAQLDELTQSIFIDMFGDPVKNPKEFSIVQLESLFSAKKEGTKCGPFGSALKKHEYVESGIPVWTMDNIAENKFIKNGCLYITEEKYQKLKAYSVDEGDILISRAGTVGKMCVVNSTDCPSIISTNLIRLSLNSSKIEPIYFTSLMTYFKGKVGRLKTGDDGAYTYMNTGVLKDLQIPLPPVELQQSFAKIVEQVEKIKRSHQQSLLELNNLFDSLAHKAFTGKLFSHQFCEQNIENGVKI